MAPNPKNLTLEIDPREIVEKSHEYVVKNAERMICLENETDPVPEAIFNISFYHGFLPRKDAVDMTIEVGDFLLRRCDDITPPESQDEYSLLLTLRTQVGKDSECFTHIQIPCGKHGTYALYPDEEGCSLEEAINKHIAHGEPMCFFTEEPVQLINPIVRQGWLLNHKNVLVIDKVGSGSYGEVWRGLVQLGDDRFLNCAIKKHRRVARLTSEKRCKEFLAESKFTRELEHENIVKFRGLAVDVEPILLVLEWCDNGSLSNFIKECRNEMTAEMCMRFVLEAATGMAYLSMNGVIHRDIAARNCLLDYKMTLKISDFGLSKFAMMHLTPTTSHLSYNSAPESLRDLLFVTETDVWAFALLMYEIYLPGTGHSLRKSDPPLFRLDSYINTICIRRALAMPSAIYDLAKWCLELKLMKRPGFSKIAAQVKALYKEFENDDFKEQAEKAFDLARYKHMPFDVTSPVTSMLFR